MVYAQLGSIVFSPLNSFTSFDKKEATKYAEHALVNRKNLLQPTGEALKELHIEMLLRPEYTNVEQSLIQIRLYRANNSAVNLIWGNGKNEGLFVITEVEEKVNQQLPDGTKVEVLLTVELKEYVPGDELQSRKNDARKNATAVTKSNGSKPQQVKSGKVNTQTCPNLGSGYLQNVNAVATKMNTAYCNVYVDNAKSNFAIDSLCKDIQKNLENLRSLDCVRTYTNALASIEKLWASTTDLQDAVKEFYLFPADKRAAVKTGGLNVMKYLKELNTNLQELITKSATRTP